MGSGSGHEDDPKAVVAGFLDDLVRALRAEKVKVRELTKRSGTDDGEHSWAKGTGYACTFRGIAVALMRERREVRLDGTPLGADILSGQMPGTHVDRYSLLHGDIAERYVMQEADREAQRRAAAEAGERKKKGAADAATYDGLAEKIRANTPRPHRGAPTKKK